VKIDPERCVSEHRHNCKTLFTRIFSGCA